MTDANHKISAADVDFAKHVVGLVVLASIGNVRIQAVTFELSAEQELYGYVWILISFLVGIVTMKLKTLLLTTLVSPLLSIYRRKVKKDAYNCAALSCITCAWSFLMASTTLFIIIAMDFAVMKHQMLSESYPLY